MTLYNLVCHIHLCAGGIEQDPPALKCVGELLWRLFNDLLHVVGFKPVAAI
ncbi:hypothetical protein D3C80_2235150 [compost metagenome]